jgi:uncharacterized damage-inducible protein DinB
MQSSTRDAQLIKRQLETAFSGPAWHGPSLMENLNGVSAEVAAAKPMLAPTSNDGVHSIWEIVHHLLAWQNETLEVLDGKPYVSLQGEADWPPVRERSPPAWEATVKDLAASHARLSKKLDTLSDDELRANVPGQDYSWRVLLRGIANHSLYHAGQIGLLKRLSGPTR